EGVDLQVVDEHGVDLVLDVAQHALRDRARGGEVEAEPAGRVLRTGLGRRLAERGLEAAVDHVGGAVAARDRAPPLQVDLGVRLVADLELAAADLAAVDDEPLDRRLHVEDLDLGAAGADDPLVRSEEHTSELQSRENLVCRLLLEKKKGQSPAGTAYAVAH